MKDYRDFCLECPKRSGQWCLLTGETVFVSINECPINPINKDTSQQNKEEGNNDKT